MRLGTALREYDPLCQDPDSPLGPFEQARVELSALQNFPDPAHHLDLVSLAEQVAGSRLKVASIIFGNAALISGDEAVWEPRFRKMDIDYAANPTHSEEEWSAFFGLDFSSAVEAIMYSKERHEIREMRALGVLAMPAYDEHLIPVVVSSLHNKRDHSADMSVVLETCMALNPFETPASIRDGYAARRSALLAG